MGATNGPSPFGDWEAYKKFRRATKKYTKENWTSKGWKHPKMRDVTSTQGNVYQMPEDDYQEFMTFFRSIEDENVSDSYKASGKLRDTKTPADYVDYAFGKNTRVAPVVQEGCGHIKLLEYSSRYQILRVTFTNNGSVCAFFRVPANLAATLMTLAQTKSTRSDGRHLLGVYFWDLVRIRGTVHGTRYKFIYTKDNNTGGLPGRPYGSGDNLYTEEVGPNKNIEKQIKKYEDLFWDLQEPDKREYILNNLIGAKADEIEDRIKEAVQQLKDSQYDVTRIKKQPINRMQPDEDAKVISDPSEVLDRISSKKYRDEYGMPTYQLEGELSQKQRNDLNFVDSATLRKTIDEHNTARNNARYWDAERVDKHVQQLAKEAKLGTTYNRFVNHFPNVAEQFSYLQALGKIPADAKFIQ